MRFSSTFRNLLLSTGAIATSVLLSVPAQANSAADTLRADNHTDEAQMMDNGATPMMNTDPAAQSPTSMTIVDVASSNESFNTLTQAVQAAGLANTLSGEGPYTVFAPTDEAFSQLPEGALEFLLQPENQDLLAEVLSYHVVPGSITANQLTTGGIDALSGGIAVAVRDSGIVVNNASVINPNIQASNGVVHVINRVLIPERLQQQLAARLGVQDIY